MPWAVSACPSAARNTVGHVGQAADVGQGLGGRADDADHEVGAVDEMSVAVLEVRAAPPSRRSGAA